MTVRLGKLPSLLLSYKVQPARHWEAANGRRPVAGGELQAASGRLTEAHQGSPRLTKVALC